jgi:hypothetical protein
VQAAAERVVDAETALAARKAAEAEEAVEELRKNAEGKRADYATFMGDKVAAQQLTGDEAAAQQLPEAQRTELERRRNKLHASKQQLDAKHNEIGAATRQLEGTKWAYEHAYLDLQRSLASSRESAEQAKTSALELARACDPPLGSEASSEPHSATRRSEAQAEEKDSTAVLDWAASTQVRATSTQGGAARVGARARVAPPAAR